MKKNPCDQCLVKPCCTEVCDSKNEFVEEGLDFLCRIAKNIYKPNGKKRKNVSKLITSTYAEAVQICDKNSVENNAIFNRYVGNRVY